MLRDRIIDEAPIGRIAVRPGGERHRFSGAEAGEVIKLDYGREPGGIETLPYVTAAGGGKTVVCDGEVRSGAVLVWKTAPRGFNGDIRSGGTAGFRELDPPTGSLQPRTASRRECGVDLPDPRNPIQRLFAVNPRAIGWGQAHGRKRHVVRERQAGVVHPEHAAIVRPGRRRRGRATQHHQKE
jgi:hypothetical protein